jgi:TolB protein
MINTDGTGLRQLTDDPSPDDQACVSPDGRLIAFMSKRSGKRDIWLKPIDSGAAERVTEEGENSWPSFSPDGQHLVRSSNRDGKTHLYIDMIADH